MTEAEAPSCGIDIGGTKIAGGLVDAAGEVLQQRRVVSPALDTAAIEAAVVRLVGALADDAADLGLPPLAGVGIGAAGFVDASRSTVLFAPNLAWRDEPLRADLEGRLALPVVIENDANAAAWGEFRFGGGEDVDDLLLVTVGTGVGGGIVLDGRLHRGATGLAAEIGHLRVVPGGVPCGCGNLGCLESYGSGTALVRRAREVTQQGDAAAAPLLERAGGESRHIRGPMVTELARAGDPLCRAVLAETGRWLGEGIASIAAVVDPGAVVIGGGVVAAGDLLLDPLREALAAQLTGRGHRPVPPVRPTELGDRAGMIGVADLARQP